MRGLIALVIFTSLLESGAAGESSGIHPHSSSTFLDTFAEDIKPSFRSSYWNSVFLNVLIQNYLITTSTTTTSTTIVLSFSCTVSTTACSPSRRRRAILADLQQFDPKPSTVNKIEPTMLDDIGSRQSRDADPQLSILQSSNPFAEFQDRNPVSYFHPELLRRSPFLSKMEGRQRFDRITFILTATKCIISTTTYSSRVPCSFISNQNQCAQHPLTQ